MEQLNICLIGDPNSGKKTFLNQIMSRQQQENEDLQIPTYQTVDIEGEKNVNFNFFLTPSTLKGLSKTVQKVFICDVIVIFFNLVEEENLYFQTMQNQNKEPQQTTQLNMYNSIIEAVLELVYFLGKENKILIVFNKIDHPAVDFNQDIYKKAEKFMRIELEKYFINSVHVPMVRISALKNLNIIGILEDETVCFFEEILNISKSLTQQKISLRKQSLPLRISILKKHKILGSGIVVQGIVLSGEIKNGDEIIIMPQYKQTKVKSLEIFNVKNEIGQRSQIVGLSLSNMNFDEIKRGNILTHIGCSSNENIEYNGAKVKANFIRTFNGVFPGIFLTLIGYNTKIACYIKDINKKIEFEKLQKKDQQTEQEGEDKIVDSGTTCYMEIIFLKKHYIEQYKDFPELGYYVIMESNVIFGFLEILELKEFQNIVNQQIFILINFLFQKTQFKLSNVNNY